MLMENFLRSNEYWSLVEIGILAAIEEVEITEAQQKNNCRSKAERLEGQELPIPSHWSNHYGNNLKNYLFQVVDRTIMETVLDRDTAKQIWDYEAEVLGFYKSQKSTTSSS